jgi:hypothetical protein
VTIEESVGQAVFVQERHGSSLGWQAVATAQDGELLAAVDKLAKVENLLQREVCLKRCDLRLQNQALESRELAGLGLVVTGEDDQMRNRGRAWLVM